MKDNKSPARCSNQYALKQTSHTPGIGKGQSSEVHSRGSVTNLETKSYKAISKSPRG